MNMLHFSTNRERERESKPTFPKIGIVFALLFFVFNLTYPQIAGASLYAPGTQLEPDCPPTESLTTCGVIAPATAGANSNITSLTGLSTPLSGGQGGTGLSSYTAGDLLYASGASTLSKLNIGTDGKVLKVSSGALVWGDDTDTNIGNTNLTLSATRALALNGNSLTFDGTADTIFNDNGNVTIGGDLTITGDDLFLNTNTLGAILVADGTNFNPVVLSGDATIAASGALTINYSAAQSASAVNKGFLTSADWTTFNNKQTALGFTAENVANKSIVTTLGTSDTLYPSQNAVKTYVDNLALGLNWKNPVEIINVIGNASSPATAVNLDVYIIDTGGNTGAWSSFSPGDMIQYQTNQWVLIKAMAVGDRFGVSFKSSTSASGSMTGKDNYMAEITGGSAGAFTYTFTAPTNNDALYVQNVAAYYHNVSFVYSSSLTQWVQLSASVDHTFGSGLATAGITVSLGALTSDWSQTGAFDITTAGDINLNGGDLKTTGFSATLFNTNATTLNIGGAATTISLGAAGATVTGGGALVINSGAATALTIDSGTTGALNIGTGNNAKTINIGSGTAGNTINIGTNNTTADTIAIGSALDALSLTSTGLNVTTGGALTGVASIDTITHSATAITFAGAGTLSATGVNAITVDSGTTGAVNLGTGSNAKTITIGNTTGATALNLQSGSGNIGLQVAGTGTTGNVQIGAGGGGSATPDLLVMDIKSTSGDPTGTSGAIYYNSNTNKFRCYENSAWANCITPPGSDIQHATSYDTNEAMKNIPTGGAQVTLGTVSVTPTSATGDVYVTGWVDAYSGDGTDQPLQIVIETTSNCTGSTVGNASVTYTITSGASTANVRGTIRVSGIAVDAGASAHPYSLCAAVTSGAGDSDIMNWGIEALVIDTGADLAEIYTTNDTSLEAGDVVSLDSNLKTGVKKSIGTLDQNVIGIVSTRPGMLIGGVDKEGVKALPVALSGRVPVKVTTENGAIEPGDYLSPSSVSGVAMKTNGAGPVIGQALSAYNGEGIGTVIAFVKNFDLGRLGQESVLLGDITPKINADGSDNGLSTLVATIQSETARDPIPIVTAKITNGKQFLTDFVAARVTAIRGYFDESFAKKIHTEELCVKKSDGSEVCVNGDQVKTLLQNANIAPVIPTTAQPTSTSEQTPPIIIPSEIPTTTPEIVIPQPPTDESALVETPQPSEVTPPVEIPTPESVTLPPVEQPENPAPVEVNNN